MLYANDCLEGFGNAVNHLDNNLAPMSRCENIGMIGGCGVKCAALWDGECKEAHEHFTVHGLEKELDAELDEDDLKILHKYYPLMKGTGY